MNLNEYMLAINDLAVAKGYNQNTGWMFWKLLTELGEYSKAIEEGKPGAVISEEFADIMHMVLQIQKKHGTDPDVALQLKINKNWVSKKKTLDDSTGEIIRK